MRRVLIYRHWSEDLRLGRKDDYTSNVRCAVAGEDGVESFFYRSDGSIEIRMNDEFPYQVPANQVLAYTWKE